MTAVHNTKSSAVHRSANLSHGVCINVQTRRGATVVSATGELDASNIHHLSDYARSCLSYRRPLILDLGLLDFFGAQGIRTLFEIADECVRSRTEWAVVPGRQVSRLLQICDAETHLPVMSSIDQALEHFSAQKRARGLLQLVTKSG